MHQSGHSRAQSMQTVQFSSLRAITPRARGVGSSFTWGYCTVTAGLSIVRNVTPRPLTRPGSCGHQNTTFRTPVTRMFSRRSGMRNFQAKAWSWSSRNRG